MFYSLTNVAKYNMKNCKSKQYEITQLTEIVFIITRVGGRFSTAAAAAGTHKLNKQIDV